MNRLQFEKEDLKMFNHHLAQSHMRENHIDAWVIYDFRGSNPIMWQVMGEKKSTTRKSFLIIPAEGKTKILTHIIEKEQFLEINIPVEYYVGWEEMHHKLKGMMKGYHKVAMEYSPKGLIPTISWVDGGTIELVKSFDIEVCSSADLFQVAAATWGAEAFESHLQIAKIVGEIKDLAFDNIREVVNSSTTLTEYDVQQFIIQEFQRRNLETEDHPIVAVNENSGNPHYEPTPARHFQIRKGDWILIDLWARYPGAKNVFSDITWVGYIGREIPYKYQKVFTVVKTARDLVVDHLKKAWENNESLQGWELDMVARTYIQKAGYGKYFVHRTGHSLGPGLFLHGLGVNLDNLETHDSRKVLPGVGFSVEPGIYLPDFGVRSEINVYISPNGPKITTPVQKEVIKLV